MDLTRQEIAVRKILSNDEITAKQICQTIKVKQIWQT
jgi:hypothetical protein